MKKYLFSRTNLIFILILFLISIPLVIYIKPISAKDFKIIITDINEEDITEINEKEYFKVFIIDPLSNDSTPFVINVNIMFNENPYFIDESGVLELKAPQVFQNKYYTIQASKSGYNNTNSTILIKKNFTIRLIITANDVVDAGDLFGVRITDDNQPPNPISGVLVFIQSDETTVEKLYTNNEGSIILRAPKDRESITIIAKKDGYMDNSKSIGINIEPPWWETLIKNNYFPIIISLIILIIIILFVHFNQQKSIYNKAKEITDKKTLEKYENIDLKKIKINEKREDIYYNRNSVRIQQQDDTKIEEIRISRPVKEKEIIKIDEDKNIEDNIIKKKKNLMHENDWYKGSNDIKYEIDKLTGEIDEEGIDKWFEGVDDLKKKVDEKMKKKEKKRINDN
jgi:hypothetical protein